MPWRATNANASFADSGFQDIIGDMATYSSQGFIVDYALNPDSPGVTLQTQKAAFVQELKILREGRYARTPHARV
jgi:hypothetical protein